MPASRMRANAIVSAALIASAALPAHAVTPEEAFKAGCGGCHGSDKNILREIPTGPDEVRRAWILKFMAGHPNEMDSVKPQIVEYLVDKSDNVKSWWQFW